jgi:preprotein translocase subunit SecY
MASAAEQLAANINFGAFAKATELKKRIWFTLGILGAFAKATELKKRIWFTLGILVVYRLGTYVPLPGINPQVLADIFAQQQSGLLGMFNMFAGGAVERMAIFALSIMPYISSAIIMQLMTSVSPKLEALKKEGEQGQKKINQYTRYGTVILATVQGYGIAVGLEGMNSSVGPAVADPGYFFRLSTVITLVGGTIFLMWLGEQVTARGVGNGISLIIFGGIVAELPSAIASTLELGRTGALSALVIISILVLAVAVITFIVFVERAQRRILVQYPKRQMGNQMYGGESSHLPLKINTPGVIPPIFASALLLMPVTIAGFSAGQGPEFLNTITAYLETRRLHPGHPARQEHRRIPGLRADAPHRGRRQLSRTDQPAAGIPDLQNGGAVLFRGYQPADCRDRDNGHCVPDSVPSVGPSI